jgi:predicted transcriptional regulator
MNAEAAPSTRDDIFNVIKGDPGIHFRGLCRKLGKEIGVVQYHTRAMHKAGSINTIIDGHFKRFYTRDDKFSAVEKAVLASWHRPVEREMLHALAAGDFKGTLTQETMARTGVTSQAVTWHVNRLIVAGLLEGRDPPVLTKEARVAMTRLQRAGTIDQEIRWRTC